MSVGDLMQETSKRKQFMANKNSIIVNPLKCDQDFKELLSASDLRSQLDILNFLSDNIRNYQINYVKSFLMSLKEVIDYIPNNEYKSWFLVDYNHDELTEFEKTRYFLVDTRCKIVFSINKGSVENLIFTVEKNRLIGKSLYYEWRYREDNYPVYLYKKSEQNYVHLDKDFYESKVIINMDDNSVIFADDRWRYGRTSVEYTVEEFNKIKREAKKNKLVFEEKGIIYGEDPKE